MLHGGPCSRWKKNGERRTSADSQEALTVGRGKAQLQLELVQETARKHSQWKMKSYKASQYCISVWLRSLFELNFVAGDFEEYHVGPQMFPPQIQDDYDLCHFETSWWNMVVWCCSVLNCCNDSLIFHFLGDIPLAPYTWFLLGESLRAIVTTTSLRLVQHSLSKLHPWGFEKHGITWARMII